VRRGSAQIDYSLCPIPVIGQESRNLTKMRSPGDEMATPLHSKGEKDANAGKPGARPPTAGGVIPEEEALDQDRWRIRLRGGD